RRPAGEPRRARARARPGPRRRACRGPAHAARGPGRPAAVPAPQGRAHHQARRRLDPRRVGVDHVPAAEGRRVEAPPVQLATPAAAPVPGGRPSFCRSPPVKITTADLATSLAVPSIVTGAALIAEWQYGTTAAAV